MFSIAIIFPKFLKVLEGANVHFTCNSATNVYWMFREGELPSNAFSFPAVNGVHVLRIFNVWTMNRGLYKCITEEQYMVIYVGSAELKVKGEF